jgi:DNA modification methylase
VRVEQIGDCTLYLGDMLDVLPTLGKFDACVTDPPYGIGKDGQKRTTGGNGGRKSYDFRGWDATRPPPEAFQYIMDCSADQVIWGGNYFADLLPPTGKWLVWDKGQRINQSDGELAYTSRNGALRIFTQNRVALLIEGAQHPTQKPIEIMTWSIQQIPGARTIVDPYLGSGTTLVSCARMGLVGTGIERDERYFDIACARVTEAYRQPADMFIERPAPAKQEQLL